LSLAGDNSNFYQQLVVDHSLIEFGEANYLDYELEVIASSGD